MQHYVIFKPQLRIGGGFMANFTYAGGPKGFSVINLDLVRHVIRDIETGRVTLFFDLEHKIELDGPVAKEFIGILTRLHSEASVATEAMKNEAKAKKN
jgi:hypothetical protein